MWIVIFILSSLTEINYLRLTEQSFLRQNIFADITQG